MPGAGSRVPPVELNRDAMDIRRHSDLFILYHSLRRVNNWQWNRPVTQGREIWRRNSMFGPSIPNPNAGGRLGLCTDRRWIQDCSSRAAYVGNRRRLAHPAEPDP